MADDHGTTSDEKDAAIPGEGTPFHGEESAPAADGPAAGEQTAGEQTAGEQGEPLHPALAPLAFLLGRWEGAGVGGYPTIESFQFGQEVSFSHNGKPFLSYVSRPSRLDAEGQIGEPLATQAGLWGPRPGKPLRAV